MVPSSRHETPTVNMHWAVRWFLPLVLWACSQAHAHPAPGSALLVDVNETHLTAELRLPLDQLEIAFGHRLLAQPATVVERHQAALATYVLNHLALYAPDGRPWDVEFAAMRVAVGEKPIDLVVPLVLRPPAGAPLRRFTLKSDLIAHEVPNHLMVISLRRDWRTAVFDDAPHLVGTLRFMARTLSVDLAPGSDCQGFVGVLKMGLQHIGEGTDHLLFLLTLLLPAPLLAQGSRWAGNADWRRSALQMAKIVTAFTLGHSATLVLGALGWVMLPATVVETAIALSILCSALHALRPIFPQREAWVAGGFGLVHGMAFGSTIAMLGLHGAPLLLGMAGFNVGVEIMQLAVVASTMPWLMLAAHAPAYRWLRSVLALAVVVAATGWIGERAFGSINPIAPAVAALAARPFALLAMLALTAFALRCNSSARWHRSREKADRLRGGRE